MTEAFAMAKERSKAAKILKSILIVRVCVAVDRWEVEGETDANFSRSPSSYR